MKEHRGTATVEESPDPNTLYTEALERFYLEQYTEAIPLLETLLELQPDYPGAQAKLEETRQKLARQQEDERLKREIEGLKGEISNFRASGHWQETLEVLARLRELEPDYADPEGHAAWAEMQGQLIELYPQGIKAMEAEKWAEAVRAFQAIVGIDPKYRQAQALLERAWDEHRRPFGTWREVGCLEEHTDLVTSVAFSPDGSFLASGSYDKTVRLWHVRTGQGVYCLEGHRLPVRSVTFSPDGSLLASLTSNFWGNTVRLWDTHTGQEVLRSEGNAGRIKSVAFSPDGSLLASLASDFWGRGIVLLRDARTGQEVRRLKGYTNSVGSAAFSPDGSLLASGPGLFLYLGSLYDKTVCLWDTRMGREVHRLTGHTAPVYSVAFSPDGSLLASGSRDKTVRLWEVSTGQEVRRLEGHMNSVNSVAFSPNGSLLASGSDDKTARLWDVCTGLEVRFLVGHTNAVNSVAFSPDGSLLASGSNDKTVRLWGEK